MTGERSEALEVLREVWRGQGQTAESLDDGSEKTCRRMDDAGVGFDDFAAGEGVDLATAWHARLQREGKLSTSGGSVRELVLGKHDQARGSAAAR